MGNKANILTVKKYVPLKIEGTLKSSIQVKEKIRK